MGLLGPKINFTLFSTGKAMKINFIAQLIVIWLEYIFDKYISFQSVFDNYYIMKGLSRKFKK